MRKIILFVLFYLFLVTLGYSEGLFFKSVEIGSEFNSSINSFYQDGFEYPAFNDEVRQKPLQVF